MLRGLGYKLRMMGMGISFPSYIYGNNMSVIHNIQHPEPMLKKKSNLICYHAVRELVAFGESLKEYSVCRNIVLDPMYDNTSCGAMLGSHVCRVNEPGLEAHRTTEVLSLKLVL
jgi:hypothetical protein